MDDYRLQITVSAVQARIIIAALDVYTRTGIGQLERVTELIDDLFVTDSKKAKLLESTMNGLKQEICGQPTNGSMGISNDKVKPKIKTCYDLLKSFEKGIAVAENIAEHSVLHDGDILHLGTEPTPEVSIIRGDTVEPVEVKQHRKE